MVFRQAVLRQRSGTVVYGPFPIRKGQLAGSFGIFLVAVLIAVIGLLHERVACVAGGACVVARLGASETSYPYAEVHGARVDRRTGAKGVAYGRVVLLLKSGAEVGLMEVDPEQAEREGVQMRGAIAKRTSFDVTFHGPRSLLAVGLAFLAIALAMAYDAIKGLGRLRLQLTHGGAGLRVQRSVFGIPLSPRDISLEGVIDVRVEAGALGNFWRPRGARPAAAGRIVLVDRSHAGRALTEGLFPGEAVHLRGAVALRALLGFEPYRGGVEERLGTLPMVGVPIGMRIAAAWAGMTIGSIAGFALLSAVVVGSGLMEWTRMEAWMVAASVGAGAAGGIATAIGLTRARLPP